MLQLLQKFSSSSLKIFLSNGYSLELLFIIVDNQNQKKNMGMDDIYFSIVSAKPKRSTFDKFIKRLIETNVLCKTNLFDKRKVGLALSEEHYKEFIHLVN